MKKALLILSLIFSAPAYSEAAAAEGAAPPAAMERHVAMRHAWCSDNPQACAEHMARVSAKFKAKAMARCKAEPEKCAEQRAKLKARMPGYRKAESAQWMAGTHGVYEGQRMTPDLTTSSSRL